MADKKTENVQYFRSHLAELLQQPLLRGKFVVVHDKEVKASFDTFDAALRHAVASFPVTEFIIQQVVEENATVSFLSAAL
jgi:hypothetical protein